MEIWECGSCGKEIRPEIDHYYVKETKIKTFRGRMQQDTWSRNESAPFCSRDCVLENPDTIAESFQKAVRKQGW